MTDEKHLRVGRAIISLTRCKISIPIIAFFFPAFGRRMHVLLMALHDICEDFGTDNELGL
jgi:hypothetical protein